TDRRRGCWAVGETVRAGRRTAPAPRRRSTRRRKHPRAGASSAASAYRRLSLRRHEDVVGEPFRLRSPATPVNSGEVAPLCGGGRLDTTGGKIGDGACVRAVAKSREKKLASGPERDLL